MGMAASQARYLALTARKTNTEYEGQQVNQARVALANQSANLFNQLLELEVPTAPSTSDYTTVQYSYQDGLYGETISEMYELIDDPDGYNYLVNHYHYADVYTGVQNKITNPQVKMDTEAKTDTIQRNPGAQSVDGPGLNEVDSKYYVDGNEVFEYPQTEDEEALHPDLKNAYDALVSAGQTLDKADLSYFKDNQGEYRFVLTSDITGGAADINDHYVDLKLPGTVGNKELSKLSDYKTSDPNYYKELSAAYQQVCKDWPEENIATIGEENVYMWEDGGKVFFASKEDLYTSYMSPQDPQYPTENQERLVFYNAQNVKTKIERTEKAMVEIDGSGRATSIKYENSSLVHTLSTETTTDEAAYQDAMNQYTYDMEVYEKTIQDINAQTEKIQQQDRTLELRLRQLDTEQDALQTEMESVKKVIEKNIESTFKTFQ